MSKRKFIILLIPSNDIKPLNQLLNTHTLKRCQKASELWRTNKYDFIITSGGCCNNRKTQTIPAADIMKQWLISQKVDESKILSENKSLDTYTNIHYSLKLLKKRGIEFSELTVVSHWTHLKRIKTILRRNYGIEPICIPVEYKISFSEWLHEIVWSFYLLFDKSGNGLFERVVRKHIQKRVSS
ncbi:MAG TPA: YdcF family protein [Candidatus Bathyarchaeia archaeon]|nr:YdcF family protein [Candidatus Bathyarchaeia archaeon]